MRLQLISLHPPIFLSHLGLSIAGDWPRKFFSVKVADDFF
jgi:hypothetical protein